MPLIAGDRTKCPEGPNSRTPGKASPLLLPGVRNAADDGAEHECRDEGEEGQVDEALDTIVAEACQRLHVVLSRKNGTRRQGQGENWGQAVRLTC